MGTTTYLCDVVAAWPELIGSDPVVDSVEHLFIQVGAGVDAAEVAHEFFLAHPPEAAVTLPLGVVGVVQVGVEQDNGIREHEDGVRRTEASHEHLENENNQ